MKFVGTPEEETVRTANTPADAKALGRTRSFPLREDWEEVNIIKYKIRLYDYFHNF
jgi:predicted NAD-dependent protein-ADP-ribosyltransferase YbiA (DUF1768 family)